MAPIFFNLHMCAAVECWRGKLDRAEGVGIDVCFFGMHSNALRVYSLTEGQFANDAVLFAVTCPSIWTAMTTFIDVEADLGLTVILPKTNFIIAVGAGVTEVDRAPVLIGNSPIEYVSALRYLGS